MKKSMMNILALLAICAVAPALSMKRKNIVPDKLPWKKRMLIANNCKNNEKVSGFFKEGIFDVNALDSDGLSSLHRAVMRNNYEAASWLLQHEKIDVNRKASKDSELAGLTPLACAVGGNDKKMIKLLLAHPDIDVNCRTPKDAGFRTPLHYAISFSSYEVGIEDSMDGLIYTLKDQTACLLSGKVYDYSWDPNNEVVELLLAHPKIDVNAKDARGDTPLKCALHYNNKGAKLLLGHPNIDVDCPDSSGVSLLAQAIKYPREPYKEGLGLLLAHPNTNVNKMDDDGNTPLHRSILKRNYTLIPLLLDHERINVLIQNSSNQTPFDLARIFYSNTVRTVEFRLKFYLYCVELAQSNNPTVLKNKIAILQNSSSLISHVFFYACAQNRLTFIDAFYDAIKQNQVVLQKLNVALGGNVDSLKSLRLLAVRQVLNSTRISNSTKFKIATHFLPAGWLYNKNLVEGLYKHAKKDPSASIGYRQAYNALQFKKKLSHISQKRFSDVKFKFAN